MSLRDVFVRFRWESNMPTDTPAAFINETPSVTTELPVTDSEWLATALTVLCTAAAVLFVSFIAVVAGLV
jgi:hypothetical protein